jgi:transaldolase
LASQAAINELRKDGSISSKQIGASFRKGEQVRTLAGIDVMTIPPRVAKEFLSSEPHPQEVIDRSETVCKPGLNTGVEPESIGLDTLWQIDDKLRSCVDALDKENIESFTSEDLLNFFERHSCSDVLVRWTTSQIDISSREGKIPQFINWKEALLDRQIGLDSLMNLAGLNAFTADQQEMDRHLREVWEKARNNN